MELAHRAEPQALVMAEVEETQGDQVMAQEVKLGDKKALVNRVKNRGRKERLNLYGETD